MESSDGDSEDDWSCSSGNVSGPSPSHRVIVHLDLDCFYAQVEMIRNPALRERPLGIQQKYIIVTCNYVARQQGVTKLMSVKDARDKCPQLVLVNGEDLRHYREMSYKLTELLMSHCPLVERLGLDENFVDVTELVERRLTQTAQLDNVSFKGHVYDCADVRAGDHPRLALGSHIAAELRAEMQSRLGLSGCAGIATNKLLAKLVSGTFKPNQQTTLLPHSTAHIMSRLSDVRHIPGIGHQTAKRLGALGLVSVTDLQLVPVGGLVREFGGSTAQRLKNLAVGVDDSAVVPSGAPQSVSEEDSFRRISSTEEVLEQVQRLLGSLVERMQVDGRQPQTFRLTIRRHSTTNKWLSRESRQCPIPPSVGQRICDGRDDAVVRLLPLAMKLFHKMVPGGGGGSFHLTLINVCFSNLQTRTAAAAITSFFSHTTSPKKTHVLSEQSQAAKQVASSLSCSRPCTDQLFSTHSTCPQETPTTQSPAGSHAELHGFEDHLLHNQPCSTVTSHPVNTVTSHPVNTVTSHPAVTVTSHPAATVTSHPAATVTSHPAVTVTSHPAATVTSHPAVTVTSHQRTNTVTSHPAVTVTHSLPPDVDPEVFRSLPEEIQKELLSSHCSKSQSAAGPAHTMKKSPQSLADLQRVNNMKAATERLDPYNSLTTVQPHRAQFPAADVTAAGRPSASGSSDCCFPGNVDPRVFGELPPDLQRELLSEWKQHKNTQKAVSSSKKTRRRSTSGRDTQSNNLFKYFKPA